METSVSCIIPCYNEAPRVGEVLDVITKTKGIDQIICVDDGSNDGTYEVIKENYPEVELVGFEKNQGKSEAVKEGLKKSKGNFIFLCDSDLEIFDNSYIERSIEKIKNSKDIGMIILKRSRARFFPKFMRNPTILGGERILKKEDLNDSLKSNPNSFQLEPAINRYMKKSGKKVFWSPFNAGHVKKTKKRGWIKGHLEEIKMTQEIISYRGPISYLSDVLFFCRKRLPNS